MKRRHLFHTSAGFLAALLMPGVWSCQRPLSKKEKYDFKPWDNGKTLAPVIKVTPEDGHYIHTYYDVCSLSMSERYLAVTRLPYQDRIPALGDQDKADVCLIDLEEPKEILNPYIDTTYSDISTANFDIRAMAIITGNVSMSGSNQLFLDYLPYAKSSNSLFIGEIESAGENNTYSIEVKAGETSLCSKSIHF